MRCTPSAPSAGAEAGSSLASSSRPLAQSERAVLSRRDARSKVSTPSRCSGSWARIRLFVNAIWIFFHAIWIFFSLRLCAEALTRGPGGLPPARDTHSCKQTTLECSACSSSSHNKQNSCTSDALQSSMQHEKIGRFVSGGAYEGKQNTSGEQPDVLVSPRKAPSA